MDQTYKASVKSSFTNYFFGKHEEDLMSILREPDRSMGYPVFVDCEDLLARVQEAAPNFYINAPEHIDLLKECIIDAQKQLLNQYSGGDSARMNVKPRVFARLVNIQNRTIVGLPTIKHLNNLIAFNATVTKASTSRMLESFQTYQCNKCGYEFNNPLNYREEDLFSKPRKCPNGDCKSDKFAIVNAEKNFKTLVKDYQVLKVQEKLDMFALGIVIPKSMMVILDDDLVDSCKPGDDITVYGVVLDQWARPMNEMRSEIEIIIHANFVKVNNEDDDMIQITPTQKAEFEKFWMESESKPFTARNLILASLCPRLYGMYIVKLAVALLMTGGVSRRDGNGTTVRGESHLLLVGDPGTGKSQFLKCVNKLTPRSIMTTGIGSTTAGLTATASRDGGIWHLEAGALVLADGDICCVDEFNCMREHDKTSMLEAMEQQSISVAKAGIVCRLKTECSVLAACNPKGNYDSNQPLTVNIALSSPLLSRFDVVLLLLDSPNKDWDHLASMYLLEGKDLLKEKSDKEIKDLMPFKTLRLYLHYVKKLQPALTPEANAVIQRYYQFQRRSDDRNAARTTVRMLESLIRLSQAHAKLMFRQEVLVMDAVVAITLMECSLNKSASFGDVNILHTSFPVDAEVEYKNQAQLILNKLDLGELAMREVELVDNCFDLGQNDFMEQHQTDELVAAPAISGTQFRNFDIISQLVANLPSPSQMISSTWNQSRPIPRPPLPAPVSRNNNPLASQRPQPTQRLNDSARTQMPPPALPPPSFNQPSSNATNSAPSQSLANKSLQHSSSQSQYYSDRNQGQTQNYLSTTARKRKFEILSSDDSIDLGDSQKQPDEERGVSQAPNSNADDEDEDDELNNLDIDAIVQSQSQKPANPVFKAPPPVAPKTVSAPMKPPSVTPTEPQAKINKPESNTKAGGDDDDDDLCNIDIDAIVHSQRSASQTVKSPESTVTPSQKAREFKFKSAKPASANEESSSQAKKTKFQESIQSRLSKFESAAKDPLNDSINIQVSTSQPRPATTTQKFSISQALINSQKQSQAAAAAASQIASQKENFTQDFLKAFEDDE